MADTVKLDNQKMLQELMANHDFAPKTVVDEKLLNILMRLGNSGQQLRRLYKSLAKGADAYTYKTLVGDDMVFRFRYEGDQIEIVKGNEHVSLNGNDFMFLLGCVDAVFSPIYPIGTVLILDKDLLASELTEPFVDRPLEVVITSRKIPLEGEFSNYLIDYLARFWPYGEIPHTDPLFITNMMIERVEMMGPANQFEHDFSEKVLRTNQLALNKRSAAFMDSEAARKYVGAIQDRKEDEG